MHALTAWMQQQSADPAYGRQNLATLLLIVSDFLLIDLAT
jgi:hypothetical protein